MVLKNSKSWNCPKRFGWDTQELKIYFFFTPCGYHLHSFTKKKVGTTLIATDQLALENSLSIGDRPYST
jgi:hypothetical protein